ncbi:hypothetical protein NQ176_g8724 [Zarea fungicola]|uniref:Uncharacterized protein n=1 Tax=Zarea fungicola TaxID=93591 RepID=A0ACC1MS32_9HYPO|nr:hypothetical protein NQ176_g8724 [Lecanicillium fungicola]
MNSQSNSRRGAVVPTRFRCKVGGEWRDLSEFSNAQQKNLTYLTGNKRQVDPAHSGMTCKEHSAGSRTELRCDLCRLVKPLDDFSKNSRRNGEQQCRRCVAWVEIQETDVTPGPLETGHISPEEEQQHSLKHRMFGCPNFFDNDDDLVPRAPITSMSSLGLDDDDGTFDDLSLSGILSKADTYSTTSSLPPHLRHKASTNASASASVASAAPSEISSSNGREPSLPPHLVNRFKAMSGAGSSASSTIGMSLPTTLLESDSDADSVVNRSFNAWDPNGMYARRGRSTADSLDDSTDDSVGSESLAETDPNVVGSWDKVAAAPALDPSTRRKGGWVKGSEMRMSAAEIRESLGVGEVYQQHMHRDVDAQKRFRPIGYDSDSD